LNLISELEEFLTAPYKNKIAELNGIIQTQQEELVRLKQNGDVKSD